MAVQYLAFRDLNRMLIKIRTIISQLSGKKDIMSYIYHALYDTPMGWPDCLFPIFSDVSYLPKLVNEFDPEDSLCGDFRVSYKEDLSELNSPKKFLYSNNNQTVPIDPTILESVAWCGSSPVFPDINFSPSIVIPFLQESIESIERSFVGESHQVRDIEIGSIWMEYKRRNITNLKYQYKTWSYEW